jgi:transcriptional regulator with XRE-family HTH domain
MTNPGQDWTRLGLIIKHRRRQLGYGAGRRKEFAEAALLSDRTLARLESGERLAARSGTKKRLEAALGWESGSVDNVVAGGEPALAAQDFEEIPIRALRGRDGTLIIVTDDKFELAIMEADLPAADKAEAIIAWREQGKDLVADLLKSRLARARS